MVFSRSEVELLQHSREFEVLSCRNDRSALWSYFKKNWIGSKDMWVMLYRMDLPHFRNNTNNRLENLFGKLKIDLSKSMSMKQCLDSVLRYQRRREDEYIARVTIPGTSCNLSYGEEMNQLLGMTSE
ncbi:unnamed protein product [Phytophthora fragariaefolia]|uniref:Unnamed protein product n=1 Tax=Phytophthora fragariaefolia TaxID=1490495 RepID=A0A9W6TRC0_9STRA|nr:unnamed protein product [Phytophthora fragariaefolia]